MEYYKVTDVDGGILTFLAPQDSFGVFLNEGDLLKANHNTVWLKREWVGHGVKWRESITTRNVIESLLERGIIKPILRKKGE